MWPCAMKGKMMKCGGEGGEEMVIFGGGVVDDGCGV